MKPPREALFLAGLVAAFVALGLLLGRGAAGWGEEHAYSTHDAGPRGVKALFLYLARHGHAVERWERPADKLPEPPGTLVVVSPAIPLSPLEGARIMDWVGRGGTLVVAGIVEPLTAERAYGRPERSLPPAQPSPVTAGVHRISTRAGDRFTDLAEEEVTLAGDADGAILTVRRVGRGRVLALADPWPLTNGGIRAADNLALAENLARAGGGARIRFDEYHHGFRTGETGLWRALPAPVRAALLQLGLGAAAWLALRGRRFGPVRPLPPAPPRPGAEFVTAVAGLYRRARARRMILAYLARPLLRELAAAAGLPPEEAPPRALARAAARRRGVDEAELARLLARCREPAAEPLSEGELVDLARRIDGYRKGLAAVGGSDNGGGVGQGHG